MIDLIFCIVLYCELTFPRIEEHFPQLRSLRNPNYRSLFDARWRPICAGCRTVRDDRLQSGEMPARETEGECLCSLGDLDELLKRGKHMICPACRLAGLCNLALEVKRQQSFDKAEPGNPNYRVAACLRCHGTSDLTSMRICTGCGHVRSS